MTERPRYNFYYDRYGSGVIELCGVLGWGGEGEIFLGYDAARDYYSAVKFSVHTSPQEASRHLAKELDRCHRAAGEGAVALLASNLRAPHPFLAFECASGGTLEDEIARVRQNGHVFKPVHAVFRASKILTALASIHANGIIHRDVKPSNAAYFNGWLKMLDFGCGRTYYRPASQQTRFPVGTPRYAAPEQLRYNGEVSDRSDVYSVGVILYELLTGATPDPFKPNPPPSWKVPGIHDVVDTLVGWLLHPNPQVRPSALRAAQYCLRFVRCFSHDLQRGTF